MSLEHGPKQHPHLYHPFSSGLCFAPVYIPRTTYSIASWRWQPTVLLNSQVVLHNLFIQPGYNHYVFGDYYGVPFSNSSTVPAYLYHQRRTATQNSNS
jgi:hypothetical protein